VGVDLNFQRPLTQIVLGEVLSDTLFGTHGNKTHPLKIPSNKPLIGSEQRLVVPEKANGESAKALYNLI